MNTVFKPFKTLFILGHFPTAISTIKTFLKKKDFSDALHNSIENY
jgi:hypothetical protein